jgi:hypothetical protein
MQNTIRHWGSGVKRLFDYFLDLRVVNHHPKIASITGTTMPVTINNVLSGGGGVTTMILDCGTIVCCCAVFDALPARSSFKFVFSYMIYSAVLVAVFRVRGRGVFFSSSVATLAALGLDCSRSLRMEPRVSSTAESVSISLLIRSLAR